MNETTIEMFRAERNGGGEGLSVEGGVIEDSRRDVEVTRIALEGPK